MQAHVNHLTREGGLNSVSMACCMRSGYIPYGSQTALLVYQGIQ